MELHNNRAGDFCKKLNLSNEILLEKSQSAGKFTFLRRNGEMKQLKMRQISGNFSLKIKLYDGLGSF